MPPATIEAVQEAVRDRGFDVLGDTLDRAGAGAAGLAAAVYGGSDTFRETPQFELPLNVYGYSKLLFDQRMRRECGKDVRRRARLQPCQTSAGDVSEVLRSPPRVLHRLIAFEIRFQLTSVVRIAG